MSLVKRFIGNIQPKKTKKDESLCRMFLATESEPDFPFTLALQSFENLEKTSKGNEEFFHYLIEDIVFTSLYATYYEHIFLTIKQNSDRALELTDSFEKERDERDRIIGKQTENHVNFILNKGLCPGCECCDNHADVGELISYLQKGDIDFFISLYLGMQTIQFAMEQLLYDFLPTKLSLAESFDTKNILEFRKFVFEYSEKKL